MVDYNLTTLDLTVIALYAVAVIIFGVFLGRTGVTH
jgi:hypothetical protein